MGFRRPKPWRGREPAGIHVPIVALTADVTSAGRAACLAAGMDDHLAKPFRREALHTMLSRWLGGNQLRSPASPKSPNSPAPSAPPNEPILDGATLDALRALPKRGPKDMLVHIGELYLVDSRGLIASIEQSLSAGNAADLARAAHAWRSYNGNVGAHGLGPIVPGTGRCSTRGKFCRGRLDLHPDPGAARPSSRRAAGRDAQVGMNKLTTPIRVLIADDDAILREIAGRHA